MNVLVATLLAAMAGGGCTLALDTRATQCRGNQDCARFAGATCDLAARICVAARAGQGGAGGGVGAGGPVVGAVGGGGGGGGATCRLPEGCVACSAPVSGSLLNSCSDATCVPFDNRTRLSNLNADGGLKPLP